MVIADPHVSFPKEIFFGAVNRKVTLIEVVEVIRCGHFDPSNGFVM